MSGPLSVIAAGIALFFPTIPARVLYFILAAVAFVVASFDVWRREYRKGLAKESELWKEIENTKAKNQPECSYENIAKTLESWELALLRELCKPDAMFNEPGIPAWLSDRGYPVSEHPLADINKKTGWLEQVQLDQRQGVYRLSHRHLAGVKKALGI